MLSSLRGLQELPPAGANETQLLIYRTYMEKLGREPETGAIAWWSDVIQRMGVKQFTDSIDGSAERKAFLARGGTPLVPQQAVTYNPATTAPDIKYADGTIVQGIGENRQTVAVESNVPTNTVSTPVTNTTNGNAVNNTVGGSVNNTSNSVNNVSNTSGSGTNTNTNANVGNNLIDMNFSWDEVKESLGIAEIKDTYLMAGAGVAVLLLFGVFSGGKGRKGRF